MIYIPEYVRTDAGEGMYIYIYVLIKIYMYAYIYICVFLHKCIFYNWLVFI
jgi:hypothetical protein